MTTYNTQAQNKISTRFYEQDCIGFFSGEPLPSLSEAAPSTNRLHNLEMVYWDAVISVLGTAKKVRSAVSLEQIGRAAWVSCQGKMAWLAAQCAKEFNSEHKGKLIGELALIVIGGLLLGCLIGKLGL